ncbi:F0F1 ATP synthase subunit B [Buchnera aphidicola (Chaitoregma tattakana)]|uniref:F0F1 ATP synthase subunit B n=1 Tax=Buchnera aphidicola TaxID=9 RepID=UPI0031B8A0BD
MNINATILGQTISFFLFVFFCARYIWPNIINSIIKRQKEISSSFELAENRKIKCINMENKAKKYISLAKLEAKNIIHRAKSDRNLILEAAILNAEQKRKVIISDGTKKLNLKKNLILQDINKEVTNLSILISKKILEKYIKKKDIDKIFNKINFDI